MNEKNNINPNCIQDNDRKLDELINFGRLIDNYIEDELDYYKLEYIMDMIINDNTEIQMLITNVLIIEMLLLNPNKPIKEDFISNDLINIIQGSSGLCAGNTLEEALNQGMAECYEHYVGICHRANE